MPIKNKEKYNEYMRNYLRERYRRRKTKAIEELGNKCTECDTTENLEFHHVDPSEKDFTVTTGATFSEERWNAEVAKCILLCMKCHREKHSGPKHGTISSYRYCKCDKCKAAKSKYNREYHLKNKNLKH